MRKNKAEASTFPIVGLYLICTGTQKLTLLSRALSTWCSGCCSWRDPARSCLQNAPIAAAPLLRAGKIEAVDTSPSVQRAVGMVRSLPKLCSATAALQLCPFSDSAFMSMAITHLILDLHEIELHTCEMKTGAKHS